MQTNHTGMSHMHPGMSQTHTGMSQMNTGYHQNRNMGNPMQMNMAPGPNVHGHMGMGMGGGMMGHNANPMGAGMGNNMQTPYTHTGQNHLHFGLNARPMGMNPGTNMGNDGGMNHPMGMGIGQVNNGPHPGLNTHCGEQGLLGKANQIWITGEFFGVQRARDMLLNIAVQKAGPPLVSPASGY